LPGLSCYDFAKHSRSARVSIAGKLLIVSGALIGVLVVLAALNERCHSLVATGPLRPA